EPAARAEHEEPALLQPLQGFTNRRPADTEIARKLLLAHAFAAGNAAIGNGVAQAFIDKVRPGARPENGLVDGGQGVRHVGSLFVVQSGFRLGFEGLYSEGCHWAPGLTRPRIRLYTMTGIPLYTGL